MNLAPGDPVSALINPESAATLGPDFIEPQREALGLNKPLPVRYVPWLSEIAHGNLGFSTRDHQSIAAKLAERVGPTLRPMATALHRVGATC